MGSHQSSAQLFNQSNWREVSSPFSEVIQYQNCNDRNIHIERHRIRTTSQDEFDRIKDISFIRKHNPRWVAALYFEEEEPEDAEFCASKYEASLFLQKIPIRLCDLRNIPFPDVLHLYDQALHGFYELARVVGCFPVESDYIGINERGVVKVWAGPKWSQITVKGGVISQQDMVRSLVECLQECIDKRSMPLQNPSIRNFLYRTSDRIGFEQAITELKNFSRVTSVSGTPTRLHSIQDNPGRYDTDRERIEQKYFPLQSHPNPNYFNSQSSSQIPNHYSPRFSAQRQQGVQQQITTFRRVDSLSNEPIHRPVPVSNFAVQRRPISSHPNQVRIDRSLSNPHLPSGSYLLRPNSSLKQLDPEAIAASNYPSSHRVSIGSHLSPQLPQQPIYNQVIYRPNSNMQNAAPNSQVVRMASHQNSQIRPQYVMIQQQMNMNPPSNNEIPMHPVLHQEPSYVSRPSPHLRLQPQFFTQQSPQNVPKKNAPEGQSIIMQLYASQDNAVLAPNAQVGQTKHFGFVKRSESYHVDLKKFDSATVINDSQPGSIRGIPQAEIKYLTPMGGNKNEQSNLNSIEQVQTQHFWKDTGSRNNSEHKQFASMVPESLSHLETAQTHTQPQSIVFKNNHTVIDENDGKSSQDFMRKLKQMSYNSFQPNSSYVEKKKSVGFADTRDVIDIDGSRKKESSIRGEYNFGKSAESKQQNYLNDYYESKLFPSISQGHPGIDPDIWADLQRFKQ